LTQRLRLRIVQGQLGNKAAVYFDAVNQYALDQCPDQAHAFARLNLAGDAAASLEQLHRPRAVRDGRLVILVMQLVI
jgi:hypothetical protein